MTLEIQCDQDAETASTLLGVGTGTQRKGAVAKTFSLCTNHGELFQQIDRELVEDGWAPAYMGKKPVRL